MEKQGATALNFTFGIGYGRRLNERFFWRLSFSILLKTTMTIINVTIFVKIKIWSNDSPLNVRAPSAQITG
tara:strand:+ start:57 stop:269 length:213 start_codon:yes stop_codon:yes gene_type:complete